MQIDNTACERALRPISVGRRNYLFAGSETGGRRAATAYTLLGSAALAKLGPWAYLRDVLQRLIDGWPNSRIDYLLPPNFLGGERNAAGLTLARALEPGAASRLLTSPPVLS